MRRLYICQTVYQILLSVIKREKSDHILFLGSRILPQSLYISEKDIPTMQAQKQYYTSIISEYINTYDVYLKVHPRDEVDYSDIKQICLLESHIPMELYELLGSKVMFDIVATHSSSAIEQIKNAKERKYYKDIK